MTIPFLVALYTIVLLGTWITMAREWSFDKDSKGHPYGSKDHSPEWALCIFFAFFIGLFWPLSILCSLPWHKWPIKLKNERAAIALDRQKRIKEIERDLEMGE